MHLWQNDKAAYSGTIQILFHMRARYATHAKQIPVLARHWHLHRPSRLYRHEIMLQQWHDYSVLGNIACCKYTSNTELLQLLYAYRELTYHRHHRQQEVGR